MKKPVVILLSACRTGAFAFPVLAEVGITDKCQEEVKELEDKIEENKDDYSADAH